MIKELSKNYGEVVRTFVVCFKKELWCFCKGIRENIDFKHPVSLENWKVNGRLSYVLEKKIQLLLMFEDKDETWL